MAAQNTTPTCIQWPLKTLMAELQLSGESRTCLPPTLPSPKNLCWPMGPVTDGFTTPQWAGYHNSGGSVPEMQAQGSRRN